MCHTALGAVGEQPRRSTARPELRPAEERIQTATLEQMALEARVVMLRRVAGPVAATIPLEVDPEQPLEAAVAVSLIAIL